MYAYVVVTEGAGAVRLLLQLPSERVQEKPVAEPSLKKLATIVLQPLDIPVTEAVKGPSGGTVLGDKASAGVPVQAVVVGGGVVAQSLENHAQLVPEHDPSSGPVELPCLHWFRFLQKPHKSVGVHVSQVVSDAHGSSGGVVVDVDTQPPPEQVPD